MEQLKLDFTAIKEDLAKIKAVIMSLQFNDLPHGLRELLDRPQTVDMAKLESIEVADSIFRIQRDITEIKSYLRECHIANEIIFKEGKRRKFKDMIGNLLDKML